MNRNANALAAVFTKPVYSVSYVLLSMAATLLPQLLFSSLFWFRCLLLMLLESLVFSHLHHIDSAVASFGTNAAG